MIVVSGELVTWLRNCFVLLDAVCLVGREHPGHEIEKNKQEQRKYANRIFMIHFQIIDQLHSRIL